MHATDVNLDVLYAEHQTMQAIRSACAIIAGVVLVFSFVIIILFYGTRKGSYVYVVYFLCQL